MEIEIPVLKFSFQLSHAFSSYSNLSYLVIQLHQSLLLLRSEGVKLEDT